MARGEFSEFFVYLQVMITLEQIKDLQERIQALDACLDITGKRKEVASKTEETLAPDFWSDPKAAEAFLKKLSGEENT